MPLPFGLALPAISWGKLLVKASPYLLGVAVLGGVYYLGSQSGQEKIQKKWDTEVAAYKDSMDKMERQLLINEQKNRNEVRILNDELASNEKKYSTSLGVLRSQYNGSLLQSRERASVYQAQSQAGAAQCSSLASHAAQLDRSLTEGRSLVGEFRITLEQRDAQLRAVSSQLIADRKLIGDNNEESAGRVGQDGIPSQ